MAHFAKLGVNGKVIAVHGLDNDKLLNADGVEDETVGQQELQRIHGWPAQMWIMTSYNTRGGKYYNQDGTEGDQSKAKRGNYAGIGYSYDEDNDIFWSKQPHASWSKHVATASWKAPITYPTVVSEGEGESLVSYTIYWDETAYQADNTTGWKMTKENDTNNPKTVYNWNGTAWA